MTRRRLHLHHARISSRLMVGAVLVGALAGANCSPLSANDLLAREEAETQAAPTDMTADAGAPTAAEAKTMFEALEPGLAQTCGGICHESGMNGAPPWLQGPDPYATVKAYSGIVVANSASSSLLTKGKHEGPPLPSDLVTSVTAWLNVEAALLAAIPVIETPDIAIPTGDGALTLPSNLGQITFSASLGAGVLELTKLSLVAPATTGVHVAGVHIVLLHNDGTNTHVESLAGADTTAAQGQTVLLDVGLAVIPQVLADDRLQLIFDKLEASSAPPADAGTTGGGGCQDVGSYTDNAVPAIQDNGCLNCHDTGGSGNGALDMSALNLATPDYDTACAQAKNKINTTNPANSPIILAPTGGEAAHPFKNANASFVTAMTTWITAEQ